MLGPFFDSTLFLHSGEAQGRQEQKNGQLIEPLYPKTPSILLIIIRVRHVHSYKYFIPAAKIQ